MRSEDLNIGVMRALLWSGILLVLALIVAQWVMMRFVPPPSPNMSAEALADLFRNNQLGIQAGCFIQCFFWSMWVTWAIAMASFIRKMERGIPVLTYASVAINGGGYIYFMMIPLTWAVIAFRIDVLPPVIVQVMNDWVWFNYLYVWPPFSIWMVMIGFAILQDKNVPRIFPRWVAFYNFWCALLIVPAGFIGFFKTGPFAYDGLISFWLAFAIFFSWLVIMTWAGFRALKADQLIQQARPPIEA